MTDLSQLANKLLSSEQPIKIEPTLRRVRATFGGAYVLDTTSAKYVWESPYFPHFYVPRDAFTKAAKLEKLKPVEGAMDAAFHGKIIANGKSTDRVLIFDDKAGPLAGLVKVDFKALDEWYEELTPVLYHPKNPYHRVDILPTSRKIKVEIDGVTIAEADSGVLSLWETHFRPRWYLPKTSIANWELLTPTETHTGCPYKGEASYYTVNVNGKEHKDVVWWYPYPITESATIAGMVCFYNEKVDTYIDGVKEDRQATGTGTAAKL